MNASRRNRRFLSRAPARDFSSGRDKPLVRLMESDVHYKVMQLLEANPELSQRELARKLGVSVGKVNYCLRALMSKGWVKASNFTNSRKKAAYMYLLTPRGIEHKARLAIKFLQLKTKEYEALRAEIEQIRREARLPSMTDDRALDE